MRIDTLSLHVSTRIGPPPLALPLLLLFLLLLFFYLLPLLLLLLDTSEKLCDVARIRPGYFRLRTRTMRNAISPVELIEPELSVCLFAALNFSRGVDIVA